MQMPGYLISKIFISSPAAETLFKWALGVALTVSHILEEKRYFHSSEPYRSSICDTSLFQQAAFQVT